MRLFFVVLLSVIVGICLHRLFQKLRFYRLQNDVFTKFAVIHDLNEPLRCMQTGEAPNAQQDAFRALVRVSKCNPITYACWEDMWARIISRYGLGTCTADLKFLQAWCTRNGVNEPLKIA